jgi:hypothetical protein
MCVDWAERAARDFMKGAHAGSRYEYSTREPFRRREANAAACPEGVITLGLSTVLKAACVEPAAGCFVEEYYDVVFMGHIVECGSEEVPSGGWVRVTLKGDPLITDRLAYVMAIYSIGPRYFLALDIYPPSALHEDVVSGDLSSVHWSVTARTYQPGGDEVEARILEATEQVLRVAVLTKLAAVPVNDATQTKRCMFVPKAGAYA